MERGPVPGPRGRVAVSEGCGGPGGDESGEGSDDDEGLRL